MILCHGVLKLFYYMSIVKEVTTCAFVIGDTVRAIHRHFTSF